MKREPRVILIGGSSHLGKSTLAAALGARPGWTHISTDSLARHPGRPWPQAGRPVREHVAEHYLSLSVDDLIENVLRHYKSMWPGIAELITSHATDPKTERLVLEGSALWPTSVATLDVEGVRAIWLTAGEDLFRKRIEKNAGYEAATGDHKIMIEKFLGRTVAYNEEMMRMVENHGLTSLDVEAAFSGEDLAAAALKRLAIP